MTTRRPTPLFVFAVLPVTALSTREAPAGPLQAPKGRVVLRPTADGQRFAVIPGAGVVKTTAQLNKGTRLTTFSTSRGRALAYEYRTPYTTSINIVGKRQRAIAKDVKSGTFSPGWDVALAAVAKAVLSVEVGNANRSGRATVTTRTGRAQGKSTPPLVDALRQANQLPLTK